MVFYHSHAPAVPATKTTEVLTPEKVAQECSDSLQINEDGSVEYLPPDSYPVCFVAGTLVHTKEGLKPIEQLKVGDYVLSKPDSGEGEQAYKRVTQTFVREAEELYLVQYVIGNEVTMNSLVVTGNHPFWKDGWGWTAVHALKGGDFLLSYNSDDDPWIFRVIGVFATDTPDVGWAGGRDTSRFDYEEGPTVDLRNGQVKVNQPDEDEYGEGNGPFKQLVYNIEVEDFHTYYVGEAGVWVHNSSECNLSIATIAELQRAACFTGSTLVHTEIGLVEISDLCNQIEEFMSRGRIGVWKVLSRCEKTGEVAYRIVTNTFCRRVEMAYSVVYLDAFGIRGVINTTPEHPFWIVDKGWVLAGELQIGDAVKTIDGFVTVCELRDANWGGILMSII